MSSSNKKKLRTEAAAPRLTERQAAEQKEAAKVKAYTIAFFAVLLVLVVIAVSVAVSRSIAGSGVREKNTTAATIGSHAISNAELTYFYMDAINQFSSQYGSYAFLYGLDTTKPLNEQVTDEEAGTTWADDFIQSAIAQARSTYALVDAANAEGFTLPAEMEERITSVSSNLDLYAMMSGAANADAYLKSVYGFGATKESYLNYYRNTLLAGSYQDAHMDSLTYTADEIRAADAEDPIAYNAYSYNQYYLAVSRFMTGGSPDEEGSVIYSEDEKAAAVAAAEAAAKSLTACTSAEEFDAAIAALPVNADTSASSSAYTDTAYSNINTNIADWVADASRQAGDTTYAASSSTDADGVENINGFYAVIFVGSTDNKVDMVNVRHVLIGFEGGTEENGVTVYSDEEKAAAAASAAELLAQWQAGEATEDSFAALASVNSDDEGSASEGGLIENIYPGRTVASFNDWCFDASRKSGDVGIVESEYGCHIIYFVGTADQTYRDYMVETTLRNADLEAWFDALVDAVAVTEGNTAYIRKDLVLNSGN